MIVEEQKPLSLEEQIAMWQETEIFLNTAAGKYLQAKSDQKCEELKIALVKVNPSASEEIERLQREYKRYNDLFGWLREVIEQGEEAYQVYQAEEYE